MRFRDPRYTGANRCWPCTLVNAVIVVAVVAVVAFTFGETTAGAVGFLGVALIVARGYVVPGTPRLAAALPDSVLAYFDKGGTGASSNERIEDVSLSDVLIEAEDGPLLKDPSRSEYESRAAALTEDAEELEDEIRGTFPSVESVSVSRSLGGGENWFGHDEAQNVVVQWGARPIAAMDVAGVELIESQLGTPTGRGRDDRDGVLALLRRGARTCPACGGELSVPDGPTVTCCGGRSLVGSLRCEECGYAVVDSNDFPAEERESETDGPPVEESAARFPTDGRR